MRVTLLLAALAQSPVAAAEPVDYVRDVKPVLKQRCFACHGALAQKAKLRLDAGPLILKGGRHGPAVKPGDPAGSLLVERVSATEESERMPPEGPPLTAEQVEKIKAWVAQGAPVPAGDAPEPDPREHWAFRPIVRPPLPAVKDPAWGRTPVDAFVAAEHDRLGLRPAPPADRATLLRRVHLDLIGLPPTRDELRAFLADDSTDAYERVVDRLLSSPQYGERWARHWMDVWRYSDWYGRRAVPDVMNSYPHIWRWRDWIVRSLVEDRGYDWMVRQMLAADELNSADDANVVATGYLVRSWFKWNYNQWMKDVVEHTGKAFLGLTFNCCHCHDHKYDPITHREYFAFRAFFEPLELRQDRVAGLSDPGPFRKYRYLEVYGPTKDGLIRVFDEKLDATTFMYTGGDARNVIAGKPPVEPAAPAFLGGDRLKIEPVKLPPHAWYPGLKPFIQEEETARARAAAALAEQAVAANRAALVRAEKLPPAAGAATVGLAVARRGALRVAEAQLPAARSQLAAVTARIAADKARYLDGPGNPDQLARAASKAERQANLDQAVARLAEAEVALAAARQSPPGDTKAKAKLDQLTKAAHAAAQAVNAARKALALESTTYSPLSPVYPPTSTGRRAALAKWLTDPANPLPARVAVNHVWGWHFGRPIVESTHDLGRNGKRPTHPALIDWLAAEFIAHGWSQKHLHRVIVLSSAYRMASQGTDAHGRAADPDNRYLWHFPVQRMEAEVVRDSMLAVAGELDPTVGGPELPQDQGLTTNRRSIYYAHHGEARMPFLELFDAADPCECYRRTTSILPQQALALVNSDFAARRGRVLAHKLAAGASDEAAFVRAAFEQVLGRAPTAAEQTAAAAFLARQAQLFRTSGLSPAPPDPSGALPATDPALRARENLVQALLNHNDFVTVR